MSLSNDAYEGLTQGATIGERPDEGIGKGRMKAIVVTDEAAGTAGMTLVERPEPEPAINEVVVEVHASGFTSGELTWPSTWTDRLGRDRAPSIPGQELAGVVTALGYGTTGLSVGQRVFGLTDSYRGGGLAEYVAIEARNLAPLPGDVDFAVGASLPMPGLTAWQGLFEHGRLQAGQSVLVHGAAGSVGSMVTQLAREFGAYVIGTGRAADRQTALDFGAMEFVDLDNDALEDVGEVDLVFDVIGGDIQKRSAGVIRAGGTLVTIAGPAEARPADGLAIDFVVEADRAQLGEIVQRVRDGRLRTNIGNVATLDDAVAAFNPTERISGQTIIRVRPWIVRLRSLVASAGAAATTSIRRGSRRVSPTSVASRSCRPGRRRAHRWEEWTFSVSQGSPVSRSGASSGTRDEARQDGGQCAAGPKQRGLAVANGSRFWCRRREIGSTRLESPRERR